LDSEASTCASIDAREDALLAWFSGRVVVQPTKAMLLAATAQATATVRSEEMGMANSFAET